MELYTSLWGNVAIGVAALFVLMFAAEQAVNRILSIIKHYGYSSGFAGLTVFALATSLPEIFAHLVASIGILRGTLTYEIASATVLGANIGSDIIQQTLLLGIVILLMGGITFKRHFLKTAYAPMIGTTLLCILLGWDGTYSRLDGFILVATFVGYIWYLHHWEVTHHLNSIKHRDVHLPRDITISIFCFVCMLASAHFLLQTTQNIVVLTGIGGSLIGVVSLGVAAAAPEFFTALSGIRQKAPGISLGTLIGSNITNPLVAIGGGALLSTYWVPRPLIYWDLPMETITAALLLLYLIFNKRKLGRRGAIGLICLYFIYLLIRVLFFAVD
jgi:cation:H+ antiporter